MTDDTVKYFGKDKFEGKDIIIIGGGAAGLMCGIGADAAGNKLTVGILEKMPRPARKIMITGKGRCNFTNMKTWNEFSTHIHPGPALLKPAFYNLTPERLADYMRDWGMESVVERGDRVFPESHLASDVVDTLAGEAKRRGAEILCNKEVCGISVNADACQGAWRFRISTADGSSYFADRLVIATGGLSYPSTGSSGDGYIWANELGHHAGSCFPSLTALVPKGYKTAGKDTGGKAEKFHIHRSTPLSESGRLLCGNQLKNVGVHVFIDGNLSMDEFGDIDFTDGGIEGPIGFKVSRKCVNALINGSKVRMSLDMKPAVDLEDLDKRIQRLWDEISSDKKNSRKTNKEKLKTVANKVLPSSLVDGFIKSAGEIGHNTMAKALKNWEFEISGFVGYERCVITAGGIPANEIFPKTMESRIVPGLYFAGEILDLDADTGGYNLHIAFSTGYLAGISAAKSLGKILFR